MLLPREIVKFARSSLLDPFARDATERLYAEPAATSLLREASAGGQGLAAVILAFQTLRVAGVGREAAPAAEFVATVPPGTACPARPTAVVLREMLAGPHREVIALGYEISEAGFVGMLHEAALQCSAILLLCDRAKGSARLLRDGWPRDRFLPEIHENVEIEDPPFSSMHCKTLLVDGEDLLVSSANFTFHGLGGNIELGVRLRGEGARGARPVVLELLRSGLFRAVGTDEDDRPDVMRD
jgi:hypothetical protein